MTEIIASALDGGIEFVHQLGYQKFKNEFLNALEEADEDIGSNDKALCYYFAANIYSLHEAPLASKKYYDLAIGLNNDHFDAELELIEVHAQLGEYDIALQKIKGLQSSKERSSEVLELEEDIKSLTSSKADILYSKGDLLWEMNEEIANENFDLVIDTFGDSRDTLELQILARAFGAINDLDAYLSVWEEITSSNGEIELDFSDWFYMPESIFQDPEIWALFKSSLKKITSDSFFMIFDTLTSSYPKLNLYSLRTIMCDYYIALFDEDAEALKEIQERYNQCKEMELG